MCQKRDTQFPRLSTIVFGQWIGRILPKTSIVIIAHISRLLYFISGGGGNGSDDMKRRFTIINWEMAFL